MEPMTLEMMKRVEEVSLNAWPPLRQILYDGWVCRFAGGYTRRANSVNPIYAGGLAVAEKIGWCERLYRERGLKPIFKITPFALPDHLDGLLAERGYQYVSPTSVQVLDLSRLSPPLAAAQRQWEEPADIWLKDYMHMNQVSATNRASLAGILANIEAKCCFMSLLDQDQTAACGLGVLEGHYVGLFDIVTAPEQRRHGFGTALIMRLLNWAKDEGAQKAYLQVMLENEPALNLYGKLGFQEIYRYWYRVK